MIYRDMLSSKRIAHVTHSLSSLALHSHTVYLNNKQILECPFGTELGCTTWRQLVGFSRSKISKEIKDWRFRHGFCHFSSLSTVAGSVLVQARDPGALCEKLENAIHEGRLSDAWNLHDQHLHMEGFPRKSVVNNFVVTLAGSSDAEWLNKAYVLFQKASEEQKLNLFEKDTLIYLSFTLARCGLPIPASTIIRKLIEVEEYPSVSAWSAIIGYMAQTSAGAYLAAEMVLEIGYFFLDGRIDVRKKSNAPLISMRPNTTALNISLAGCLLFGTTRKAEQLLDMMPRIALKTDTTSLIIMAHIFERNSRRDELKKLKRQIDESHTSDIHFQQFYNCLLSSYLKLGDLEAASIMVLEMLQKARKAQNSLGVTKLFSEKIGNCKNSPAVHTSSEPQVHNDEDNPLFSTSRPLLCYEHVCLDRKYSKLEAEGKELLDSLVTKLQGQVELITTKQGILQPTEMLYVKLVKSFLEAGRTKDLAEFLIRAEKEETPVSADNSALIHVINACISLGWLDQAHDLLDEMLLAGIRTGSSVYANLLKAYCKENRVGEVTSLLRDVRKAGIQLDASCYEAMIQSCVLQKDTPGALSLFKEMKVDKISKDIHQNFEKIMKESVEDGEPGLMSKLLHEIKEGQRVDCGVHDWNNMIHFFCKKRLMHDAENALKKMRSLGHAPNAETFHSLIMGYAAVGGKYTEIAELWGQIKSISLASGLNLDQELLDSVLYSFVRGGFFIRANEVIEILEKRKMFVDKYKYRALFLKYHKTLCKGKPPKFQTESQINKREAVLSFKKWIGLS